MTFAVLDDGETAGETALCPVHSAELRAWAARMDDEKE
jgi:hypothetical protein